jgi:hypothetical protein
VSVRAKPRRSRAATASASGSGGHARTATLTVRGGYTTAGRAGALFDDLVPAAHARPLVVRLGRGRERGAGGWRSRDASTGARHGGSALSTRGSESCDFVRRGANDRRSRSTTRAASTEPVLGAS